MKQNFFQVGGALSPTFPSYIQRDADEQLYRYLKEGKYCYVLNARQVGKSSLRVRISKRLENEGYKCFNIELPAIGGKGSSAESWYFSLLDSIVEQLGLNEDVFYDWWYNQKTTERTIINRFFKFFDEFVLKQCSENIVFFIDEIDDLLAVENFSRDNFFATIRSLYNLRSEDERYNQLTFALFGVATAEELMEDANRTPFNIAHSVNIKPFTLEEVLPLIDGLNEQKIDGRKILEEVYNWTSGTPYLTQKILNVIREYPVGSVEEVKKVVFKLYFEDSFKEINIFTIKERIIQHKKLNIKMLYLVDRLIKQKYIDIDNTQLEQVYLKLSGLVKEDKERLVYANKIYEHIFNDAWLNATLVNLDRPLDKDLQRWVELDRANSALLKGEVLKRADQKIKKLKLDLTPLESEYLRLSQEVEAKFIVHEEKKKRQEQAIKRLRVFLVTATLLLIALGVMFYFLNRTNDMLDKHIVDLNRTNTKLNATQEELERKNIDLQEKLDKEKIFQKGIDQALRDLESENNKKFIKSDKYIIPLNISDTIKVAQESIDSYNIESHSINDNGALIQLVVQSKKENFPTQHWVNALHTMNSKQKQRLFEILIYDAYCDRGKVKNGNSLYGDAIKYFDKAIEINATKNIIPFYHKGLSYLGLAYIRTNNDKDETFREAIVQFKNVIEKDKNNYEAWNNMALIHRELKEFDKAFSNAIRAIQINSKYDKAYLNLGDIYSDDNFENKNYQKAEDYYRLATQYNQNNDKAWNNLGYLYWRHFNGKLDLAINAFEKATSINKSHYKAWNNLGVVYTESNQDNKLIKAIESFQKSLSINSEESRHRVYINLFKNQLKVGQDFNKTLEEKYSELFKDKEEFKQYKKLKE